MSRKKTIILIGYMGCGKSTLGRKASKALDYDFMDTDSEIEKEEKCTIAKLFEEKGEAYFRNCETRLLRRLIREREEPAWNGKKALLVATGGGMPVQPQNEELLKTLGTVIYLKTKPETLLERLKGDTQRPLLSEGDLRDKINRMLSERGPIYERVADVIYLTDDMSFYEMIGGVQKIAEEG